MSPGRQNTAKTTRGVGRVGRSRASRRANAHGFGKRRPRAASFGEALKDLAGPLQWRTYCKSSASASFATLAEFGSRSIPANYTAL